MTHTPSTRRAPGTRLLALARLVFDEAVVASIVVPTIADMQQEVAAAGDRRLARWRARTRGWIAFWWLALLAPFTASSWPVRHDEGITLPLARGGAGGWILLVGVLAFTAPALGAWSAATVIGGLAFAVVIHLWNRRHPAILVSDGDEGARRPEINFSSLRVGGNVGGLIFMAGSMAVLIAGLPAWHWFFAGCLLGGLLTAVLLGVWHDAHPQSCTREDRLLLR